MTGVLTWLLSWILLILILWFLAANRWGHTILYYLAWLAVLFLLLTNGKEIASILSAGHIGAQTKG